MSPPDHTTKDNVDDRKILIKEHQHYLNLRHDKYNQSLVCLLCLDYIKHRSPFYRCDICIGYCVHKSCGKYSAQLPNEQINHPFHSSHGPLHLFYCQTDWCRSCHRSFENIPFYRCSKCYFSLDFRCASPPQQQCKHICHQHPLLLIDDKYDHDNDDQALTKCFACQSKLSGSGQAYYGCSPCGYYLDKFCAEFPMEFQHPLHDPQHGLLTLHVNTEFKCSVCEFVKDGPCNLGLKCQRCEFWLCWKCNLTLKKGNINCEDHEHLLCFMKEAGTISRCDGYDAYCRQSSVASHSKEFDLTKSSVFKCLDCGFKLHLLCGPLPSTVKYELHIHSLTLYDSFLEDNSGEYYCDVCETQRDPRIRVYCCAECKYFAHVHCLISEIVNYFNVQMGEQHNDVKLKVLGEDSWGNSKRKWTTLTLKDLLHQFTEYDKQFTYDYFKLDKSLFKRQPKDEGIKETNQLKVVGDEEINELLEIYRFSKFEESFQQFCNDEQIRHSQWWRKLVLEAIDLESKLVEVKGYLIPYSLAGVFETILIHEPQLLNSSFKGIPLVQTQSFVLFNLCKVVKGMSSTMVQDLSINILREWRIRLYFVSLFFLDTGFVSAKLRKVGRAFVGLQDERLEREIPAKIDDKMERLRGSMNIFKQYRESPQTEFAKGCLKEASELKWKNAF